MLEVLNTGDKPVRLPDGQQVAPGGRARVDLDPDAYRRLCVEGPLAVLPPGLFDDRGRLATPPVDVLRAYGLDIDTGKGG